MNRMFLASMVVAVGLAGSAFAADMSGMKMDNTPAATAAPATQPGAVDLGNTVCPVSGDKVGDSKLTETYNGKIYHFCCEDCPKAFKKDPAKYEKAVNADPAKYGVKTQK